MTKPYGCHNKPRPVVGAPVMHSNAFATPKAPQSHPFRMTPECQYDQSKTDPGCAGCKWGKV
jgi:hypothetical protein